MGNSENGKDGERCAVRFLLNITPTPGHVARLGRILGAGRRDDIGDVPVFPNGAIQAPRLASLTTAIRTSAVDAAIQARRSGAPLSFGVAPTLGASSTTVNWVILQLDWPAPIVDEVPVFGDPNAAVAHIRNEKIGVPRRRRITRIERAGAQTVWICPRRVGAHVLQDPQRPRRRTCPGRRRVLSVGGLPALRNLHCRSDDAR